MGRPDRILQVAQVNDDKHHDSIVSVRLYKEWCNRQYQAPYFSRIDFYQNKYEKNDNLISLSLSMLHTATAVGVGSPGGTQQDWNLGIWFDIDK